ncbi:MAG: bifunctional diaminohydroxyphosphoribosylaminopyrimidine deaminase/5-amino-6-(5-phosphoribosylamino)uracil reductase RibD [Bacteroidales bacterium]|nr:bifunctional diaminohydroxyphosphoribosylaminopyrimidine deaminase/5-amino-6-(5-phosphoribosylamino)uracil reductase RibD [Bacteroidales bacterium]
MTQEEIDKKYMRRCLQLAANGLGRVRPNPLVGCVVARQTESGEWRVESEGYHQYYGGWHAERNALLRASQLSTFNSQLSTLYVNLEPCSHYGHTPPCADLIIEKGIRRVVCCNDDPNPLVAGGGFRKLEAAGIEVVRHVLEAEGRELNRRFFTFMEQQRPYVILKWAESKDGYMAPSPNSQSEQKENSDSSFSSDCNKKYWLSTQEQNRLNHRWRTEEAAILVGSETFLRDHPSLTARHYLGSQPQPVVLDRRGRLLSQSEVISQSGLKESSDSSFSSDCNKREWLVLRSQTIPEVLHALYEHKLQSVIVEGGRQMLDAFIESGLYDEVRILRSLQTLGSGLKAPAIPPIAPNRLIIIEP